MLLFVAVLAFITAGSCTIPSVALLLLMAGLGCIILDIVLA